MSKKARATSKSESASMSQLSHSSPKFYKKTLKNGLRYLFIPMKETQTILAMVLVATGADFESKKQNGLSHFLEHMCFKGTTKRPSAKSIALEFDTIGADYNAFTSRGLTGYFARAHKKHAGHIFDIVSDVYLNSTFPQEEIEKEKGVVIQEINMYADDPHSRVAKLATHLLYGDQPAGWEILGTKETVSSFSRADLVKYRKSQYDAKNTLVVIAGNFDEKTIESEIKKAFGKMPEGKKNTRAKTIVKQSAPQIAIDTRKTDQTHLILTFRAYGYENGGISSKLDLKVSGKLDPVAIQKKISALRTLTTALGGGMSSRLFQKMREELGICYYVGSSALLRPDAGNVVISAGVANDRVKEALEGIMSEVRRFKEGGISLDELKKVKEYRLSGLVLHLETTEDFADFYGKEEILRDKITTEEEVSEHIEGVKKEEVDTVAKEVFVASGVNLAITGPFGEKDKKDFLHIISKI
ncbi:MAG: insulinase family protein [Candidatus Pacebacteria bacterium]|nr:insulinase family protein [Candidatus Paceibacterota bacterium]